MGKKLDEVKCLLATAMNRIAALESRPYANSDKTDGIERRLENIEAMYRHSDLQRQQVSELLADDHKSKLRIHSEEISLLKKRVDAIVKTMASVDDRISQLHNNIKSLRVQKPPAKKKRVT